MRRLLASWPATPEFVRSRQMSDKIQEKFRLRNLVERLATESEVDVVPEPVELADVAARLDGNPKAVLFRAVGAEKAEFVGNVMGSRRRLALALGVEPRDFLAEVLHRGSNPIAPV